jgi:hypothetical protein
VIPEHLLQEIETREAEFSKSTLEIFAPDKGQEAFIDFVCRAYLEADGAEKSTLVSRLSGKEGILNCLLGNAYRCAEMLKKTGEGEWLRLGLASSYLASQKMDYRDVLLAWAELYVIAEEAGVPPDQDFQEICRIADFGSYAVVASRRSGTHKIVT